MYGDNACLLEMATVVLSSAAMLHWHVQASSPFPSREALCCQHNRILCLALRATARNQSMTCMAMCCWVLAGWKWVGERCSATGVAWQPA